MKKKYFICQIVVDIMAVLSDICKGKEVLLWNGHR